MGPEAGQALSALSAYEYWPLDTVSPGVIETISAIAQPIFVGLQRISDRAIAKYGEQNQTEARRARFVLWRAAGAGPRPQRRRCVIATLK